MSAQTISGSLDEYDDNKDMCPICKTDRYLSPDLKFLVNPECYHKICENCVDRIFSLGPAQCPYKGCDKILRKNKFKTQVFDDVGVEKEVDIRKRVFNVFNKTIDDFNGNLDEFNKYLEDVEDIVYNLDHGVDVEKTEERLRTYEELNKQLILNNIERSKKDVENFSQRQQFEKEMKLKKKLLERQIEEEDRFNKEWAKKEIVNRLMTSSGGDTMDVIEGVKNTVKLKKSSARRKLEDLNRVLKNNPYFVANNMGQKNHIKSSIPYTPFNGDRDLHQRFEVDETKYNDPLVQELEKRKDYIASGFRTDFIYERVLTEAFMGLGCVISEERT
ncbi:similar to Saccharomyces cerevisiae YDR460W TFB3 Subunit of TFIIH and nucleotide excision repair factor 3 complexes, involved in transcription initiation, required for nucleotide excision repair [Maudiozyma barnettii]|uniref:RNA polymerase II transcription factor B subunit 3 n=1 Tax=Maudiozyma barnettii TaxID=61262 RepID=A0A8H2ZGX5_9SACH|nr:TFIIH/NER complex subunit TFB3 [Kazachstania barnettii]CAB4255099.1 similar to Saccharomyces cerevisiae YDR460W TFB3 Subunit of TFIIH and nucleotide excision repair factor 3 complexes, involved in transcription initiation, required for nucleotide excision repair [Kazachstania barnettii]CAD1783370.1 similar to Saccharomyces cerevisiae YDR460W TFB3 Subunit of TFIIH and nucleotide excision repair factor 3 complexes, involved in transcription initiation, required for nucleotide excision repair [Ka